MIDIEISRKVFNTAYLPYLESRHRYLVFYGGAGSGKSFFIVQRYLYRMMREPMLNLLVVRAVGKTNRDSTFALFKQVISKWGLSSCFKVNESEMRITCTANRNGILFKGLDDAEKLKSITFEKGDLTDEWLEEASEIQEADFNQLDIRLRGKGTKKQIVVSFNPVNVNHWLKKRFFDHGGPEVCTLHTTYRDNAFLEEDYKRLLESYRDTDPYYYDVYCLGRWGVLGKTVFDARAVNDRISALESAPPPMLGRFVYDTRYDPELNEVLIQDDSIRWENAEDGYIRVYTPPRSGVPYVIGGDTAGEGSDWFIAQVVDNTTGMQAAVLRQAFDEDIYAKQVYCLGKYYNTALVGIEANFSSYPVRELERLRYPKQYVREAEDSYTHRPKQSFGFRTDRSTRPVAIAGLVQVVREESDKICDSDTLSEMLTFVRSEQGRPEAQQGAHDDLVMALAIAHYIRPQQSYTAEKAAPERRRWMPDMWEDYRNADEAGRAYLIGKWGEPG